VPDHDEDETTSPAPWVATAVVDVLVHVVVLNLSVEYSA
jgi:hypothetical protein